MTTLDERAAEALEEARKRIAVAALSSAFELDLSGLPISALPPEIGQLQSLASLILRNTQISTLPPEIGRLQSLTSLSLRDTPISTLPPEIGQLWSLTSLTLRDTPISALPPEIGQLRSLASLSLVNTPISALPPEIGQLQSLTSLSLRDTPISALPPEIGQLQSLTSLSLRDTPISALPPEIGQLRSLTALSLSGTPISALPPEIGRLQSLTSLNLRNTPISALPPELGALDDSLELLLEGARLPEPYPELIGRGTPAVLAYLRSLADGEPQYEAKVLLVGEGNVGKTSLVAAMLEKPFVEDRPTTHGIELGKLSIPHPELEQTLSLNTWDFGGQEVYRVTHQFFFSRRSLYLLVWRPREGQEENAIEGWLERIRLRAGDDIRVMIVATHCKERHPELDYPELLERFGDILVGHHQVDNADGTGISELKVAIAKAAAELPQMGERLSMRWITARDEIRALGEPQIERRAVDAICERQKIDDSETETLIDLLHDLGHIIYFGDDEGLRNAVVLRPEWLTKAIGYVLEDGSTRDARGELDHARLHEIWWEHSAENRDRYPPSHHRFFLRLMEKFDICYRIPDRERSLVGQLVPWERPPLPWTRGDAAAEGQRELALVGELSHEAPGLMAWLTVRNHWFATGKHWRRGVFLAHNDYASEALLELAGKTRLHLTVHAPSPDYFFSVVRASIEELIARRWEGLSCEFWVPCPTAGCAGRFSFHKLLRRRERGRAKAECDECDEEFDVQQLLTGFPQATKPIDDLVRLVERVDQRTERLEETGADVANGVRAMRNLLSQEVTDCPRMFVLAPKDKKWWDPSRALESDYVLSLCCEHPGHEHVFEQATYPVSKNHEWLQRAGPYASVVSKTLRVAVPIAGAFAGTMLDDVVRSDWADEMKLMDRIAGALPGSVDVEGGIAEEAGRLSRAQHEGLRALRQFLLGEDTSRKFGGMRRVVTPSGDVLWVCPDHYRAYDPGLPVLPYDTDT